MEYLELKRTVLEHAREWSPRNVLIEDRASSTQLIQELSQEGMTTLTCCDSKMEKKIRMSTASNLIENVYVEEMVTFDNGKHDDQVDSTSQALNWYKAWPLSPRLSPTTARRC